MLSSSQNSNAPLIRVSRKRSADPHDALIIQIKKIKQADPVVFTLFKTKSDKNEEQVDEDFSGIPVVDLPLPTVPEAVPMDEGESSSVPPSNPLEFVSDSVIGQIGDIDKENKKRKFDDKVTLNGCVMEPVQEISSKRSVEDDIVFDYYRVRLDNDSNVALYSTKFLESNGVQPEAFDVRFASRHEAELINNESDESDVADDDDDSNAEDNWRNDYPDEDSYDEESDPEDYYGELRSENWHPGESAFNEERLNHRFANFEINDRYESYFEGEDTEDEDYY